ncbi:protein FANTASTIC FOUR 1-like [Macadamia integrifolia]|uniref:protein FANTASTIC FOUR 1-like n=1 Tax=Macadamia integrifolia TaxID=60698 RepID=UPI001C4E8C0B|nr:protein FANTASTIC FOUR 1-like [Macadamia integrifolia]
MSTAVCQGLQSCLEPWTKLTATSPYFARSLSFSWTAYVSDSDSEKDLKEQSNIEKDNNNNNNSSNNDQQNKNCDINNSNNNQLRSSGGDMGGWSFIRALTNTSEGPKAAAAAEEKEKLYIHPLVKKRSLKLSERSLEMCTENLGSETGSVISEDISIQPLNCEREKSLIRRRERANSSSLRQLTGVNSREFPPPLTTISWSSQVKVKTHREGGRLLMKTVRVPCSQSCFQAEREDGRLRLHLSSNYSKRFEPEFDPQATSAVEEEEEAEAEAEAEIEGGEEEEEEDDRGEGNEVEEEEEEEEEEELDDDVKCWGGGTNGNNNNNDDDDDVNVGGEVEMGTYERGRRRRRSRCNEGEVHWNNLLLIQEPCCWVATS